MYIKRNLENVIKKQLFKGKVIIIYGPRQAGKTTLVKKILEPYMAESRYIDCELLENRTLFQNRNSTELFALVDGYKVIVLDEAQTVPEIGSILKSLIDHRPDIQYIATGSSSFDLANSVSEPLTGRSLEYTLYPMDMTELYDKAFDIENNIDNIMRYGFYPGIIGTEEEKIKRLSMLTNQYLYKNVLAVGGIKKPDLIVKLLKLLAHQIGQEVSIREISKALETSVQTIEKYIDLLEKNYIIIRLSAYSNNMRREVTRHQKIYFVDIGIRNILIENMKRMDITERDDVGAVFENLAILERLKYISHTDKSMIHQYFWRMSNGAEIDYIESNTDQLIACEFKWNVEAKVKMPRSFMELYPNAKFNKISKDNLYKFVLSPDL